MWALWGATPRAHAIATVLLPVLFLGCVPVLQAAKPMPCDTRAKVVACTYKNLLAVPQFKDKATNYMYVRMLACTTRH